MWWRWLKNQLIQIMKKHIFWFTANGIQLCRTNLDLISSSFEISVCDISAATCWPHSQIISTIYSVELSSNGNYLQGYLMLRLFIWGNLGKHLNTCKCAQEEHLGASVGSLVRSWAHSFVCSHCLSISRLSTCDRDLQYVIFKHHSVPRVPPKEKSSVLLCTWKYSRSQTASSSLVHSTFTLTNKWHGFLVGVNKSTDWQLIPLWMNIVLLTSIIYSQSTYHPLVSFKDVTL